MAIEKVNVDGSVTEFFELLREMRGITPIAEKMHKLLCDLQQKPAMSVCAQKVLYLYLSLLEDGNTRIPLDEKLLFAKWSQKWTACFGRSVIRKCCYGCVCWSVKRQ